MWWRLPAAGFERLRGEGTKRLLREVVDTGQPPGIRAYVEGVPVGWCAIGPREAYIRLSCSPRHRRALAPVDDAPAWSDVCFYVLPPA